MQRHHHLGIQLITYHVKYFNNKKLKTLEKERTNARINLSFSLVIYSSRCNSMIYIILSFAAETIHYYL